MRRIIMIIGIAVILFSISNAEVPHLISYQGILKDSTGEVVEDNVYALKFSIYNDSTEGLLLWESEGYVPLQITNGLFQHVLGSTNPIPDSISSFSSLWLGVAIGLESELPRTQIVSVPFSISAQYADTADYAQTSNNAYRADSALFSDYTDSSIHAIFADTSDYSRRNFPYYHRIAYDLIADSTNSETYIQVGNTLTILPDEVTSFISIVTLAGAYIGYTNSCYMDIRIGESGTEESKDETMLIFNDASGSDARTMKSILFYYEPTDDEKMNGFNVKIFLKVSHYSYRAILKRCEVFGL